MCNPGRIKPDEREYEFCFVEVGEPSRGRNRDSRSGTRSHVMKDFYGKQRNTVKSCAASREIATCQTQRFRVGLQGLQELKRRRKRETRGVDKSPPVSSNWTIISNTPRLTLSPTANPVESTTNEIANNSRCQLNCNMCARIREYIYEYTALVTHQCIV